MTVLTIMTRINIILFLLIFINKYKDVTFEQILPSDQSSSKTKAERRIATLFVIVYKIKKKNKKPDSHLSRHIGDNRRRQHIVVTKQRLKYYSSNIKIGLIIESRC